MRFLLDENVDSAVCDYLRRRGHECWSVVELGLQSAEDDAVAVAADDRDAVLVTHDRAFVRRLKGNTVCSVLAIGGEAFNAKDVVEERFADLDPGVWSKRVVVEMSAGRTIITHQQWK